MTTTTQCETFAEQMGTFVDGTMSMNAAKALEAHLQTCAACQASVEHLRAVKGFIEYTQLEEPAGQAVARQAQAEESQPEVVAVAARWYEAFSGAPWWLGRVWERGGGGGRPAVGWGEAGRGGGAARGALVAARGGAVVAG